ncbi:hypothetical protein ACX3X6_08660 [Pseudomonas sichuanensis]
MALKLNEKYPGRFNNPTADYPQGSFKNRTTPTSEDGSYFEQDWANDHLAFLSSLLAGAGFTANGDVDKVGASQYYSALIQIISSRATDYLNTTRIDVVSSANVNLSTLAPNTRHINITGSSGIAGFTLPAGSCYFVRFAGALTLTNSASLVTQSGANITTAAGDTCVIRATAANVVEVLCYARASTGTWKNMLASRLPATNYTNPYSHDIEIAVVTGDSSGNSAGLSVLIDGQAVFSPLGGASGGALPRVGVTITIPAFSTYRVEIDGLDTLRTWWERRP